MKVNGKLLIDIETEFSDTESDIQTVSELVKQDLEDNCFNVNDVEIVEVKKTRVYISGQITGTTDYMERFAAAEKALTEKGYEVINPAKTNATLPPTTPYEGYIKVSLALLSLCNKIYLLDGWEKSKGARLEYDYAVAMGKKILKESED